LKTVSALARHLRTTTAIPLQLCGQNTPRAGELGTAFLFYVPTPTPTHTHTHTHPLMLSVRVIPSLDALNVTMFMFESSRLFICCTVCASSESLPGPGTSTLPSDTRSHARMERKGGREGGREGRRNKVHPQQHP